MAILSVTESYIGLAAHDRIQMDGKVLGDGRRFFDVTFDESDQAAIRPNLALADSRVPQLGDSHPYGEGWIYVLDRRSTVTAKSAFVYRITILYAELRDPVSEPPIIEWFSASTMEPVYVGTNDDGNIFALLNSSDEPFDPPPMKDVDDLVMRATYSTDTFNPVVANDFQNAINDRPIMIRGFTFPEGVAKVIINTARENRMITDRPYLDRVVEIQFRKQGWKRRFLDLGFRTLESIVDGVQMYAKITVDGTAGGDEITEPVMLDGSGQRGSSLLLTYREFWLNDRLNFAAVFGAFLS